MLTMVNVLNWASTLHRCVDTCSFIYLYPCLSLKLATLSMDLLTVYGLIKERFCVSN